MFLDGRLRSAGQRTKRGRGRDAGRARLLQETRAIRRRNHSRQYELSGQFLSHPFGYSSVTIHSKAAGYQASAVASFRDEKSDSFTLRPLTDGPSVIVAIWPDTNETVAADVNVVCGDTDGDVGLRELTLVVSTDADGNNSMKTVVHSAPHQGGGDSYWNAFACK